MLMSFLPQLRAFLKSRGVIYTVRKYRLPDGDVEVLDVGKCRRTFVGVVTKDDLAPYVGDSGFYSVESWWQKIKFFVPGDDTLYLYKVEVDGRADLRS